MCSDSSLIKFNKTVQMFNMSVNFRDIYKEGRPHFRKLIRPSTFFNAFYVIYKLSEIKDDMKVVSQLPCLFGHPVVK